MFDRYTIAATECHGDVFLWPLKCIADYLRMTGDHSILQERLPYADEPSGGTLLEHIERAAAHFQDRFVAGTALLSYAGGDWDDTLQPVQAEMKERLVSSWTQAIGCQVAEGLAAALEMAAPDFAQALAATARRMRQDFTRYLLIDGQIAGFVLHMDTGFVPMLHPADTLTGLRCRLIPLTRSILAELVDPEQAKRNLAQIDRYLRCPDGIRLMDKPAPYTGGVAHLFRRAEQAANVGREISLQYVHAHIRYVEAMAMLGEAERAWNGLMVIAPPMIQESVRNAVARQSNLYFSSSDGAFADRYRYAQDYERLRDGSIPVKGGWRLYSSGPGIYLRTLLSYVIGIRYEAEGLVIDPVLPPAMDGLRVSLECYGQPLDFHFHIDGEAYGTVEITCGGKPIVGTERRNRYRQAGVLVARETLRALPDVVHVRLAAGRKAR